jgi:hypothetical protein
VELGITLFIGAPLLGAKLLSLGIDLGFAFFDLLSQHVISYSLLAPSVH